LVRKLNLDVIKKETGALKVLINGPRQWIIDKSNSPVGVVREFNGLKAAWLGKLELDNPNSFKSGLPEYTVMKVERKTSITFKKGTDIFILTTPKGETFAMKSFSLETNPHLTRKQVGEMMMNSNLPKNWSFKIINISEDLILKPLSGVAKVVTDSKQNVYDLVGPGYSNFTPQ